VFQLQSLKVAQNDAIPPPSPPLQFQEAHKCKSVIILQKNKKTLQKLSSVTIMPFLFDPAVIGALVSMLPNTKPRDPLSNEPGSHHHQASRLQPLTGVVLHHDTHMYLACGILEGKLNPVVVHCVGPIIRLLTDGCDVWRSH